VFNEDNGRSSIERDGSVWPAAIMPLTSMYLCMNLQRRTAASGLRCAAIELQLLRSKTCPKRTFSRTDRSPIERLRRCEWAKGHYLRRNAGTFSLCCVFNSTR
jgi:hypothetical protein